MEPSADAAPIACSLGQTDLADRQRRWHALADRAIIDLASIGYGLRMRFRDEPGVEAELHQLAALERDCCAFADWTVRADRGVIALDVSGKSADSVPAVQEMFASLRAGGLRAGRDPAAAQHQRGDQRSGDEKAGADREGC